LGFSSWCGGRPSATLTPAGQTLADYVLRAEALLANARRAFAAGLDARSGRCRSRHPASRHLPPARRTGALPRTAPGIEIEFQLDTSGGALKTVRAHQVEIAVVGGNDGARSSRPSPLAEDEVVLVGPRALGRGRVRPTDLEGLTWISREEGRGDTGGGGDGALADRSPRRANTRAAVLGGREAGSRKRRGSPQSAGSLSMSKLEAGTLAVLDVPALAADAHDRGHNRAPVPLTRRPRDSSRCSANVGAARGAASQLQATVQQTR